VIHNETRLTKYIKKTIMTFHKLMGFVVGQLKPLSSAGFSSGKVAGILGPEVALCKFDNYVIFMLG
jgi:hypothetical protein